MRLNHLERIESAVGLLILRERGTDLAPTFSSLSLAKVIVHEAAALIDDYEEVTA